MSAIIEGDSSKLNYIRYKRDKLLNESDKYILSDYPITEEKRQEWKDYRTLLRDFPSTITNITDITITIDDTETYTGFTFPTPPS